MLFRSIDRDKLPTDANHPGEEISEENKIIEGDKVMGVEPSPVPEPPGRKNYVLIIVIIIAVLVAIFWGVRGCNDRSAQDNPVEPVVENSSAIQSEIWESDCC